LSFLYSYPYYRAKLYFPSNLKVEGVWGVASFLIGLTGALEHQLNGMPRWEIAGAESYGAFLHSPGPGAVVAAFLVFGGHTLIAILKDYKDVEADSLAGVGTVYTLSQRRGLSLGRVHLWVSVATLICIALPLPLLYASNMITMPWVLGGLLAVMPFFFVIGKVSERGKFNVFLWLMTGYLLYLFIALVQG
jgi:4-hydroxybenzoate polyprenyltransferase